jgi:hypothetical protein
METNSLEKLKKIYRDTAIVGAAIIATLCIFVVIVEYYRRAFAPFEGFNPFPGLYILKYMLLGVSVAEFLALAIIRRLLLPGLIRKVSPIPILLSFSVIYALCESIAIYGLVLFILAGNAYDFYFFFVISLICFAIDFPRYGRWAKWLKGRETGHP